MTNRRMFLGGALAASVLGWVGFARRTKVRPAGPATVEFYVRGPGANPPSGQILGNLADQFGAPARVELRSVEVGHFHGLMHEGDGRVAYLYEATIAGPSPRRGYIKLGDAGALRLS